MSTHKPAQFTPGPWVVKSTDEDINTKTIIDSNEFWIAKVLNFNRASDDIRESQANGNLIAAAPAMYEALLELVICPAFNGQVFERDKESHRAWTLARNAIAQAEGR